MKTVGGSTVSIQTCRKPGMSSFIVFGFLDGKPCHWTIEERFRLDGRDHPNDIENYIVPTEFMS